MYKKAFIFLLFILIWGLKTKSQNAKLLDEMLFEIKYDYKYCRDSSNLADVKMQTMLLMIGQKCSYFINYNAYKTDSVWVALENEKDWQKTFNALNQYSLRTISTFRVLKTYDQKDKVLFYGDINPFFYKVEQKLNIKWQIITKSDSNILNHKCKKATTQFAGRKYTSWFAPDIPIADGPYKFSGLPGLILCIESNDKQHSFFCTQINTKTKNSPFFLYRSKEYITSISAKEYSKAVIAYSQKLANDLISGRTSINNEEAKQKSIRSFLSDNNFIEKY